MADIQFGWSMPGGPRAASQRVSYVADLQRGLELIAGHYDSAWMIDHLQEEDAYLMERTLRCLVERFLDWHLGL